MATLYRGWIAGEKKDEKVLLDLGVKLGPWNEGQQDWTSCEVSSDVMEKLDSLWGRFVWGLDPVKVEG
jgi:hypothetical protein